MATLIGPAKNDFLLLEHPVNMHEEVTQWLSDLEFCNTELNFLQKLLNKYFLRISVKNKLTALNRLELKLKSIQTKNFKKIHSAILLHEHRLSELDKDKFLINEKSIRKEHNKNKSDMISLMTVMKEFKSELYAFIEKEMREK